MKRHLAFEPICFLLCAFVLSSCIRHGSSQDNATQAATAATENLKSTAIVSGGENPRFFELKTSGIIPLKDPSDAALTPFEPWPLARRIVSFLIRDNLIVAASNRDGLIAFVVRKDNSTAVYRLSEPDLCGPYSMSSLFLLEDSPVVLLYRDRFFLEPEAPAPEPRLLSLASGNPRLIPRSIPAFDLFPPAEGWDIESIVQNESGRWYFRAVRGKEAGGESAYAMADDLAFESKPSSVAAFHAAQKPLPAQNAEPVLRRALEAAAMEMQSDGVALSLSPGQQSAEPYLIKARGKGEMTRAWACSDGARAYVAFADGSLTIAVGRDGPIVKTRLPVLPDAYAYTGIAAVSSMLVASWEEQDGWAVGAAGFVIVSVR